uniref:NADH-ubiquinone oxidoreductase chain 4L n=1 Tax=Drilus flavescens TaxID=295522 RepID=E3VT95_9COLE|nr:NADH dehydrogenase subunit 4L [Drilus flavescens]
MTFLISSFLFMYFVGLVYFCFKSKHLLLMLMGLEFVSLSMYGSLFYMMNIYLSENYFAMIFLTMSVCEGALGLSILVSMIRCYGNDYFQSFSILW